MQSPRQSPDDRIQRLQVVLPRLEEAKDAPRQAATWIKSDQGECAGRTKKESMVLYKKPISDFAKGKCKSKIFFACINIRVGLLLVGVAHCRVTVLKYLELIW